MDFTKDYLLDNYFTARRLDLPKKDDRLQIDHIYDYAKSIRSVAETFMRVANPLVDGLTLEERTCLIRLARLDKDQLFFLIVATMRTVKSKDHRIKLLRQIERTGFFMRVRQDLFNDLDISEATVDLLSKRATGEEIEKRLREFTDRTIASPQFLEATRNLGRNLGYYSWRSIRYFMYEYEQHLRTLSKTSRQLLNWREDDEREHFDSDHKTVEHIYPQRANDQYWKDRFNKYSVQERNVLKNSLGNLLPVSQPKNSSLGNGSFPEKLGTPQSQVGYRYGCLSEIQVSMESEWTPLSILQRGIILLEFMEHRWAVKFGDIDRKVELLGLSFVVKGEKIDLHNLVTGPAKVPKVPE